MHQQIKIKVRCSRSFAIRGIVSVHVCVKLRRYIWWICRNWQRHLIVSTFKWNWLSSPKTNLHYGFLFLLLRKAESHCMFYTIGDRGSIFGVIFIGVNIEVAWGFSLIIFIGSGFVMLLFRFCFITWCLLSTWNMKVCHWSIAIFEDHRNWGDWKRSMRCWLLNWKKLKLIMCNCMERFDMSRTIAMTRLFPGDQKRFITNLFDVNLSYFHFITFDLCCVIAVCRRSWKWFFWCWSKVQENVWGWHKSICCFFKEGITHFIDR